MIPTFTLVTTLITVTVTVALILVLYRINAPMLAEHNDKKAAGGADGVVPSRHDELTSDAGGDGGGD